MSNTPLYLETKNILDKSDPQHTHSKYRNVTMASFEVTSLHSVYRRRRALFQPNRSEKFLTCLDNILNVEYHKYKAISNSFQWVNKARTSTHTTSCLDMAALLGLKFTPLEWRLKVSATVRLWFCCNGWHANQYSCTGLYSAILYIYVRHHASKGLGIDKRSIFFYALCILYILSTVVVVIDITRHVIVSRTCIYQNSF